MTSVIGALSVAGSAVAAHLAKRFPARIEAIETAVGVLLLGGFALIGCALPAVI